MLCDFAHSRQALMCLIMMRLLLVAEWFVGRVPATSFANAGTFLSFSQVIFCSAESMSGSITKSSVEPLLSL